MKALKKKFKNILKRSKVAPKLPLKNPLKMSQISAKFEHLTLTHSFVGSKILHPHARQHLKAAQEASHQDGN